MRYWTLDEALAALPEVRVLVGRLRELVAAARPDPARAAGNGAPSGNGQGGTAGELRRALATLTDQGIVVRDPGRGLIDFPARSPSGRDYLLCWLDGEDTIAWWHWPDAGFAGRTPL
ncbi:MAG TPA: DUF2203 domain-containing protein, partial [Acidimicrobiia bacterium]|nr:DUF2203 domain-containing protein [Acidimicrobiia bacterium]